MIKFSICFSFIVSVSLAGDSISHHREKRFLIFPRGNPTRHQVSAAECRVFFLLLSLSSVCRRYWNSSRPRARINGHRVCVQSAILSAIQRVTVVSDATGEVSEWRLWGQWRCRWCEVEHLSCYWCYFAREDESWRKTVCLESNLWDVSITVWRRKWLTWRTAPHPLRVSLQMHFFFSKIMREI